MDTRCQCGSRSDAGQNHRKMIGRDPICQVSTMSALTCPETVHQDHVRQGRLKPGCRIVGPATIVWLTTEADHQSSLHRVIETKSLRQSDSNSQIRSRGSSTVCSVNSRSARAAVTASWVCKQSSIIIFNLPSYRSCCVHARPFFCREKVLIFKKISIIRKTISHLPNFSFLRQIILSLFLYYFLCQQGDNIHRQ